MNCKTHKNSASVKCRWAIGLLFSEGLRYVTKLDNPSKYFYWEAGKEPLYFESKSTADDYAFCIGINGYPAVVMEIPDGYELKNPDTKKGEENNDGIDCRAGETP